MKIYLAAPYAGRDIVKEQVQIYEQAGHEVVTGWLNEAKPLPGYSTTGDSNEDAMVSAGADLQNIDEVDAVVHYTAAFLQEFDPTLPTDKMHSGGRHVETGYALALHKSVVILGEPENIFQRGLCHICPTVADALDVLDEMSEDWV